MLVYLCEGSFTYRIFPQFNENDAKFQSHPPSKKRGEGLDKTSTFRGGCWERGGDFLNGGGCNFHIKNKLKSEIFNDVI